MASRRSISQGIRMAPDTRRKLVEIAESLGYTYYERGGSIGQLLDAIAWGEVIVKKVENIEADDKR